MGTIAGTTFADTFVGTAFGVGNMIYQGILNDADPDANWYDNLVNAFVENPYSLHVTNAFQEHVKDNFMIHTSDKYRANREAGKW